jgi:cell division protein FtsB
VNGEKDGEEMQSINYIGFIPLLTKEIQQLRKEIQKLKKEVTELKEKIN